MGFSHGYGLPTEAGETVKLLRRAVDLGYTFFDTAEVYGTQTDPHANETLVGQAFGLGAGPGGAVHQVRPDL